jgi:predicted extracellular nuclease
MQLVTPRRLSGVLLSVLAVLTASAQLSYTGGTYTQNFDTLPSSGTFTLPNAISNPGQIYFFSDAPINASNLSGWSFVRTLNSGTSRFLVSDGSGTTPAGSVYSYGTASSGERALGSLASNSNISSFGVVLVNNTGATISQFTVSYTGEQWRRGSAAANTLTFSHSVGGSSITTGTFTTFSGLSLTAPVTTGANLALNGNALANRTFVTATVTGLNWLPGQTLVLRWADVDDTGSDDGLAIDDFSFTTPTPAGGAKPNVITTTPAAGAVNLAPNTNITLNFNMPVNVSGAWFSLVGSASGAHPANVTGGPTSYTLDPATDFAEGETVTVTVFAAQVTDAATGTMQMTANHVFTFNTLSTSPLPISTIQGAGTTSAYVGQLQTVQGVVTATYQGPGGLGGFYVQSVPGTEDADPATSEGMFVFNNSFTVAAGDLVRVTGTVTEFGTAPSTQTEMTSVVYVNKLGTAPLPSPVEVTLPFASTTAAERYEGMLVTLPQTLTVTNNFDLGAFGEVTLSNGRLMQPTNIVAPGAPAIAQDVANYLNSIAVDDGRGGSYPDPTPFLADSNGRGLTRRTGSTATGVTGILDEKFGGYIIEPTQPITFTDDNPRGDPPVVFGSLRVALSNVLNFFNGNGSGGGFPTSRGADSLAEYQRQRAKMIAGLVALQADILGLTEVERDGFGPLSAIADIVAGMNAASPPGTTYAFVDASGVDTGTDVIMVAFIYRTETVETVGAPAALSNQYFNGLARPPLAQTFREKASGEKLTVCVNHFRAKGSVASSTAATDGIVPNPNLDTGDGQATNNYLRKRQAETLAAWLATDPTGSGDPDYLIIGDLNAYAKEDPITALKNAGYINLTETIEGDTGYSYVFAGAFGHLDHALANASLGEQVTDAATWHVNSDEPAFYDYNLENKTANHQAINVGTAYRYSDHDPVIVGLDLHPPFAAPAFTTPLAGQTVTVGDSVIFTVAVSGYPAPTFEWQHNGSPIAGADAASLSLTNITTANAGTYTVVAANSRGTAASTATLTVNKALGTVTLGNLVQSYDGTPKSVSVATAPGSYNVIVTYDGSATPPVGVGSYAVVATIDDANYQGSATATLEIRDTTPPVLSLPSNIVAEATSSAGAAVAFTATALDDVSGSVPVSFSPASGSTFPIGTTTVTATATDAAGNTSTGTFTITVRDTTAPVITSLTASPASLWPANHKMVAVTVSATFTEAASAPVALRILSVTSSEPDNGLGDGDTPGDIVITGAMTVNLRAERAGNGNGRTYTITVEARDAAGNASTGAVTVFVPKSQGK